jgi:AcrR family transcriptional regulator
VADPAERGRRRYESPVRRQQAAATRERILDAGVAIAHAISGWNWKELTFAAVAERAGVSERTVYRHFGTERELRDAIMGRLQEEAGVALDALTLDDVADTTARVFRYLASFAADPRRATNDPTLQAIDQRRRDALVQAVSAAAPEWSAEEHQAVAAVLDVLWGVPTYERLVAHWHLDPDYAASIARWVIELVESAVRDGRHPSFGADRPGGGNQQ